MHDEKFLIILHKINNVRGMVLCCLVNELFINSQEGIIKQKRTHVKEIKFSCSFMSALKFSYSAKIGF